MFLRKVRVIRSPADTFSANGQRCRLHYRYTQRKPRCILMSVTSYNFEAAGAIQRTNSNKNNITVAAANTKLLNRLLTSIKSGSELVVPYGIYSMLGGVYASSLKNVRFVLDGTLIFTNDRASWPVDSQGGTLPCIRFEFCEQVTFTSTTKHGTLDGNGKTWWGYRNYVKYGENRPMLFHLFQAKKIIFEHILLRNSPFWSFYAQCVDGLVVRYAQVDVRVTSIQYHDLTNLQALNTGDIFFV